MKSTELKTGRLYFNKYYLENKYEYEYVNVIMFLGIMSSLAESALSKLDFAIRNWNDDTKTFQNYFIGQLNFTFLSVGTMCIKGATLEPIDKRVPKVLEEQAEK